MKTKSTITMAAVAACGWLTGCADSGILGSNVTTSSVDANAAKVAMTSPRPDPVCVALLAKIDGIRKDGVAERVEQAAQGKSSTVPVKRASLAQVAELTKANIEYQAKCSAPGLKSAYIAPAVPVAPVATAPAATPAPKKQAAVVKPAAVAAAPVAAPAVAPVAPVAVAAPVVAPPAPVASAAPAPAAAVTPMPVIPGVSVAAGAH